MELIDLPELVGFLRMQGLDWSLMASDWVLDHPEDPKTVKAIQTLRKLFTKKRLSPSQKREAIHMQDVWFGNLPHLYQWPTQVQQNLNYIRRYLPVLVSMALNGEKRGRQIDILEASTFYDRPSLRADWLNSVRSMLMRPRVFSMVYACLK